MIENIVLAIIAAIVPTITVLLQWKQQNEKIGEVHEIVNSQRTEMMDAIEVLKAEVARLQSGGENTPTTRKVPEDSTVTILDGNVTVPKTKE